MSVNLTGGGLQVSLSFLYECARFVNNNVEYHVLIGETSIKQINLEKNLPYYNNLISLIHAKITPNKRNCKLRLNR